jgi:hypothetical protein
MTTPSIKGTAYLSAHADVNALVAGGAVGRDELELALEAEDLRLLDEKVSPAAWYPIASYARLLGLLCKKQAHGNVQGYLISRGEKAGERIAASGIYQQLDASAESLGLRAGRIVVTVAGLIYNFTTWHFEREDASIGNFSIRVEEATDFPDVARITTQGFIQYAATRVVGRPLVARSERPLPSRILFHVNDPV